MPRVTKTKTKKSDTVKKTTKKEVPSTVEIEEVKPVEKVKPIVNKKIEVKKLRLRSSKLKVYLISYSNCVKYYQES